MAGSYLNIVTFLLTTLFYYMALKPALTYETYTDKNKLNAYISNSYVYLAVYVFLVIIVQFGVNISIITNKCGGSITENIGSAGIYTFLPWLFIFGVLVLVIKMFPGFKSAFSDVVGYFWVANSANKLIIDLLVNKEVENAINKGKGTNESTPIAIKTDTPSAPPLEQTPTPAPVIKAEPNGQPVKLVGGDRKISEEQVQNAADAIIKICGNTSILINQMVPENFDKYWDILTPLMKPQYQNNSNAVSGIKKKLFDLVVTRDNIGEALWYMYTGILLTSIVQMKLATNTCVSSPQTMEQNYQKFVSQQQQADEQQQQATSTTYTITN
jgi:hypothetical protein